MGWQRKAELPAKQQTKKVIRQMKLNTLEKSILLAVALAAAVTAICNAGIGETYSESCEHYGGKPYSRDKAQFNWLYKGLWVSEIFDDQGRCDYFTLSSATEYLITQENVETYLSNLLPEGGVWHAYPSGNQYQLCWVTITPDGRRWYANFYVATVIDRTTGGKIANSAIRVATEEHLVHYGLLTIPHDHQQTDIKRQEDTVKPPQENTSFPMIGDWNNENTKNLA